MNKNKLTIIAVVILVALVSIFWFLRKPESAEAPVEDMITQPESTEKPAGSIIYFYGDNCPHCKNVAKFIEENGVAEKVSFTKKEISNMANSREFLEKASQCGINQKDAGVPLVYSEGKCYVGDVDAIAFFKEKAGL